ncbi:MAG: hypothetical protein KGL34_10790 [Gammaproteobacteria bacterium]|nr:hypothetical protein [Gammaproteobacteria bacterium]
MVEKRKQAVSIRLSDGDLGRIRRIAKRLGVRDSDVIRFAIRSTLSRIAPLCDPEIRGRDLVPVLAEAGDELIRFFDLDSPRLENLVNGGVDAAKRVERADIGLLAMSGLREEYLAMRLSEPNMRAAAPAPPPTLRHYLYEKYVYRGVDAQSEAERRSARAAPEYETAEDDEGAKLRAAAS